MNIRKTLAAAAMMSAMLYSSHAVADRDTHENLNAVLWMQTSIEYQMVAVSAFKNARNSVVGAMRDASWSASMEQINSGKPFGKLPPAIIVDIDETMLDNSKSQAQTVKNRDVYDVSDKQWKDWVRMSAANPIPGAVEFLGWAVKEYPEITVFYVTNRTSDVKAETIKNLRSVGLPLKEGLDVVLTKEDSSDKTARRTRISEGYRIILLVGDDLGDFISAKGSIDDREKNAKTYQSFWGDRWVVLPNPTYGSWERALYPESPTDVRVLRRKFEVLKTIE